MPGPRWDRELVLHLQHTSYMNILSKAVFALNLLRSEFDAEAEYRQRLREQAEERSGDKVGWLPYSTNIIDQLDKYVSLLNKYDEYA